MWNKLNKGNNSTWPSIFFKKLKDSEFFEQVLKRINSNFNWDDMLYSYWDSSSSEQPILYRSNASNLEYYLLWDGDNDINDKDILIKLFCSKLQFDFEHGEGTFEKYGLKTELIISYILLSNSKFTQYLNKIFNNIENLMKLNPNLSFMENIEKFGDARTLEEAVNALHQLLYIYDKVTGGSIISENLLNDLINSIEVYHVADDYIQKMLERYLHVQDISDSVGVINCKRIVFTYVI